MMGCQELATAVRYRANVVFVVIWISVVVIVGALIAATIHVTAVAARHRRGAVRALAALTAIWGLSAGLALQVTPGFPVASASAKWTARRSSAADDRYIAERTNG